jgi:2-amino-4-hydroxy-6-hydroxymethyldihydropteridine diphosphokinase
MTFVNENQNRFDGILYFFLDPGRPFYTVSDGLFTKQSLINVPDVDENFYLCSTRNVESSVYVALGSNLGDRELNLLRAIAEIGRLPGSKVTALSGFYDTQPVGPVEQDNFLNAVLRLETPLTPHQLLSELQRIETEVFRRKRTIEWGPRVIDLDILFYGDRIVAEDVLTIPHPRMQERRFVLVPLAEIAPAFIHPQLGRSAVEILRSLETTERVTKV